MHGMLPRQNEQIAMRIVLAVALRALSLQLIAALQMILLQPNLLKLLDVQNGLLRPEDELDLRKVVVNVLLVQAFGQIARRSVKQVFYGEVSLVYEKQLNRLKSAPFHGPVKGSLLLVVEDIDESWMLLKSARYLRMRPGLKYAEKPFLLCAEETLVGGNQDLVVHLVDIVI